MLQCCSVAAPSDPIRADALARAEAAGWPWVRTRVWEFWGEANWRATVGEASADDLVELSSAVSRATTASTEAAT